MPGEVFISYSRLTATRHAEALAGELIAEGVWLDDTAVAAGDDIADGVIDGVLGAKVLVALLDERYLTRWYCRRELELALAPWQAAWRRGLGPEATQAALECIVVALVPGPDGAALTGDLPAQLRTTLWPVVDDVGAVVDLVRRRLAGAPPTIGERLVERGEIEALRSTFVEAAAIPPPADLAGVPVGARPGALRPSIGDDFVGRAHDLWAVHHELTRQQLSDEPVGSTVALEGGGGLGKSRLATEYVHRFGARWWTGGIFWLDAEQPETRIDQLHGVLTVVRPGTPPLRALIESDIDVVAALATAIRERGDAARMLFVVDNLPEPGPDAVPVEAWSPALGAVSTLVTSRGRQSIAAGVAGIAVDELPDDAAVALLTRGHRGRSTLDPAEWVAIARWVGQLPLALEVLNASLVAGVVGPRELVERARRELTLADLDESVEVLEAIVPAGSVRGVADALGVSYRGLTPEAQHLARLLAWLAPDAIPEEVLAGLGPTHAGPDARARLITRSFVAAAESPAEVAMYGRMHRVVAAFLRAQPGDALDELFVLTNLLAGRFKDLAVHQADLGPELGAWEPHGVALLGAGERHPELSPLWIVGGMNLASFLGIVGRNREEVALLSACDARAELVLAPDDPIRWSARANLARALHRAGDPERALALEQGLLDRRTARLGADHPLTLTSRANVGVHLDALGHHREALAIAQEVYDARRRILPPDDRATLGDLGNLAEACRRAGELDAAHRWSEEAQARFPAVFGADHPRTLRVRNNHAALLRDEGDVAGSLELATAVVADHVRVLGADHPNTLRSRSNRAETLVAAGRWDEARTELEQVVEVRSRTLGDAHPEASRSLGLLAEVLRRLGEDATEVTRRHALGAGSRPRRTAEAF